MNENNEIFNIAFLTQQRLCLKGIATVKYFMGW